MANATAITVRQVRPNDAALRPAADVLDTGTAAVTLPLTSPNTPPDRLFVEVLNSAVANLTVEVQDGDAPPATNNGRGTVSVVLAQNQYALIGPFESSRFAKTNGRIDLKFTPASGTINASVWAYALPR